MLEEHGKRHLEERGHKSKRLSGQVLTALDAILNASEARSPECFSMATDLHRRVTAEAVRLQQQAAAALDRAGVESLEAELIASGLRIHALEVFQTGQSTAEPALVGWHIAGEAEDQGC